LWRSNIPWRGMMETVSLTPSPLLFDVTRVASLRKSLGHAATAMKVMGFESAIFIWAHVEGRGVGFLLSVLLLLLTASFASVMAKNLRSGSVWAVISAAIWSVIWAAFLVHDWFSKPQVISGYSILWAAVVVSPLYFLTRGLLAFAAYRAHQRHGGSLTDPLAFNPYEEGLRIKKRPKFINKKSRSAWGLLILSPLPYLVVWVSQRTQGVPDFRNVWELRGYQFAGFAVGLGCLVCGAWLYRSGRRAAMLPGSALIKRDTRPFLLYLRSFQDDDGIKLRARATNGRILLERLVKIPFEEVVTDHLWGYGPVLAIGNPRTKHGPMLGAARDYVENSSWRQKATELMRKAAMIVVIANGTEGLAWEINTIADMELASKLVILLPPIRAEELDARWRLLASHSTSGLIPLHVGFASVRALIYPEGNVTFISGSKRNDWTYEAVLDEAALLIAKSRGAVEAAAPGPLRVLPTGPVRQVFRSIYSLVPSMVGYAFIFLAFLLVVSVNEAEKRGRPYASPGEARDVFVAQMLSACRKHNPLLSAEPSTVYCACLANNLADIVTNEEMDKIESDRSAFLAKAKSIAYTCSEKTLRH
jgi:hypothetical protein